MGRSIQTMNESHFHDAHIKKEQANIETSSEVNHEELASNALKHYQEKHLTVAKEICLNILGKIPGDEDSLHLLGMIAFDENKFRESIGYLQQAVQENPDSWKSQYALGCTLSALDYDKESILHFRKSLILNPEECCIHYETGLVLEKCQEIEPAYRCYESCLKLEPEHLGALTRSGIILFLNGNLDEADTYLLAALNICADDPVLRYYYAEVLKAKEDYTQAIDWLQSILKTHPQSHEASFSLAEILYFQNSFPESLQYYEHSLSLNPNNAQAWVKLGTVYKYLKNDEQTKNCFEKAIAFDPLNSEACFNLGKHYHIKEEYSQAEKYYLKGVELDPNHSDGFNNLGVVQHLQDKNEEAIQNYRKSIEASPEHSKAYSNIELALFNQKKYNEVILFCEQAIQFQPENVIHYHHKGVCSLEIGNAEEAVPLLLKAIDLDSDNAESHYFLGNAYKELNDFKKALAAYQRALDIKPDMLLAKYNKANAYKNAENYERALECFYELLKDHPDHIPSLITMANIHRNIDQVDEAIATLESVMKQTGENPALKLWALSLCPKVVFSIEELINHHKKGIESLRRLSTISQKLTPEEVITSGSPPSYFLQFHGFDSLPLKRAYGEYYDQVIQRTHQVKLSERPSVGIFVTDGHEGVFIRYLGRLLELFKTQDFELVILCSKKCRANIRERISVEHLSFEVLSKKFPEILDQIAKRGFDVLYHWEVGSDLLNYFLPFYQLAPQQVTSVGLPESTGIPQMTHYLSSRIHEGESSASQYSEKLILGQSLITVQNRMEIIEKKSRSFYGIPDDKTIYFIGQKVHKFHPDIDLLLGEILERDPNGLIVIPSDKSKCYAEKLNKRFSKTIPNVCERIHFVPRLTHNEFYCLVSLSDVILDTLYYGSGLSVLDFLSFNKPVVTLPGEFLRGKVTAGTFRHIGINEFIAESHEDYVLKANQLGTDEEYRKHWEKKVQEKSSIIFENHDAVQDYHDVFSSLIQKNRS
jgi:protein O-GlcNAc transferase